MKISALRALLDQLQTEHGDIDVCCTVEGYGSPEKVLAEVHHVAVMTSDYVPEGAALPFVLLGSDGF